MSNQGSAIRSLNGTIGKAGPPSYSKKWNPLSFLPPKGEEKREVSLNLSEMREMGKASSEILKTYGLPQGVPKKEPIYGMEVGDDRVDLSRSATKLAGAIMAQEKIVGMKTSKEDTVISKRVWNFCEVTSFLPSDRSESFHHARRVNDFSNLGFNDSVILRIILDVSKETMDHSSTPVGKMTLLGSRVSTPRAEARATWMLASWLQDSYLNTIRADDPKYLPGIMGGAGVTTLWDEPLNLYLYVKAYKGGRYSRIYGTAVSELEDCLRLLDRGQPTAPVLCDRLRDRQEYLHGTYAHMVFVPHKGILAPKEEMPPILYEATGASNRFQNVENRLIRTRHLVTRRQAEREWSHTTRLQSLITGKSGTVRQTEYWQKIESLRTRSRFDNALRANSALQNLLNRTGREDDVRALLGDNAYKVVATGQREFRPEQASWIVEGGKYSIYTIEDLTTSEDIFVREEVSVEETLKVPNIPLNPVVGNKLRSVQTRAKVGLYEINTTMEAWADTLMSKLTSPELERPIKRDKLLQIFNEDREWVNDDSLLVARALSDTESGQYKTTSVLLVTRDKRLGNQMANTANLLVYRIDPLEYAGICKRLGKDFRKELNPEEVIPFLRFKDRRRDLPTKLYLDTGSLAAALVNIEEINVETDIYVQRTVTDTGTTAEGKRFSSYSLRDSDLQVKLVPIAHESTHKPKRFKMYASNVRTNYSGSNEGPAGSWRSTSELSSARPPS
jgi:hypothetical protein